MMAKNALKKLLLGVSAPLRAAVRYELTRQIAPPQDIRGVLQNRATEATADYVAKNMSGVDSVSSNLELLTMALEKATLKSGELVCEFGVFSGSTINHIASLTETTVYGFDSFEGLPERWRDGFGKGHFKVQTLPSVRPNVVLIKGWFAKTLPEFIAAHDEPVGFLHIDCDLYASTKTILDLLEYRIRPGCVIVFDEYFNYPSWEDGEYKAFHEFLARTRLGYEYIGYNRLHEQVAMRILAG